MTRSGQTSPGGAKRPFADIWPIIVGVFVAMMGLSLVAPIVPLYAREFGVSRTEAGILVAAFAVARLVFDFAGGAFVDRVRGPTMMRWGAVLLSASSVAAALAGSFGVLLAARFLEGAGSAAYTVAAQTWVVKRTPAHRLGAAMAWFQTGLIAGVVVGPLLGGMAAKLGDFTTPFWVYAGLGLVAFGLTRLIPNTETLAAPGGPGVPATGLLRRPAFLAVMFIAFSLFVMRLGARSTLLPLYAREVLDLHELDIGVVIAVSGVVNLGLVHVAGRSLDRFDRGKVVAAGLTVAAAAVAAYGYAGGLGSLVLLSLLFGLGTSFASVAAPTIAASLADPGREGRAIGLFRAAGDTGAIAGPIGLGAVADWAGFGAGFWLSAALLWVGAVTGWRIGRHERSGRRDPESPPRLNV